MRRHCSCHCPVCRASRNVCSPFCSLYIPQPCVCPPGPPGSAATVTIGMVTTGAPGTPAEVTNSGTAQNAVLNFTIPQGLPGTSQPVSLVSSYSTPSQPGASGTTITFDRNALSLGTDISAACGQLRREAEEPGRE